MKSKRLAVTNSGPLIHLARAGLLKLIELYETVMPTEVKHEVITIGKEHGYGDALQVEDAIRAGLLKVVRVKPDREFLKLASYAGIHKAETKVIHYALEKGATALLDDEAARSFARSIGVKVRGSLGLLIEGLKQNKISPQKALEGLDKLSEIMYLSSDIYKEVLSKIKELTQKKKKQ
ncbi:MAG: hypothetical protein Q6352_018190 [Candidatus Freyrarchaeum guaymaensis]